MDVARAPCTRAAGDGRIVGDRDFAYPEDLRERVRRYYEAYYAHFGIRNVSNHVEKRLREELVECERLAVHERLLSRKFERGRALVVGLGTGGLAVCLHALGNDVHGVEPDLCALDIAWRKMAFVGGRKQNLLPAVAEALPYRSDCFDCVFCYTVLEHVRDPRGALHEMVRVLRPGGVLILNTPDYRFPFEAHYKVPLLLKPLPRVLSAAILKLGGKPARPLLREITYVTSKQVQHFLMEMPGLRFFRVFASYPSDWCSAHKGRPIKYRIIYGAFRFWARWLEVYPNQEYYIFKEGEYER